MNLTAQVTESYSIAYPNPIKLEAGDLVQIEKWEPKDSEWAGWAFCVDRRGIKGWVSEKYLHVEGNSAKALRSYDATELSVQAGERVKIHFEEFGWAWVENAKGAQGWIPLRNIGHKSIESSRLILRRWQSSDSTTFHQINSDPEVMRFLPKIMTRDESDSMIARIEDHFEKHGFGWWALERKDNGKLIGFTGLVVPTFDASFMPCVEIGWRLSRENWKCGYATEAAEIALQFGFTKANLDEIVSFTVPANRPSTAVMERLNMKRNPQEDFDHPKLEEGHPLRRHVLYRLSRQAWQDLMQKASRT